MFGPRVVSIVLVSFNTVSELLACLASIERSARSLPHEVILIDNASADGTVEAVRARFPAVRLIANDANVGFPKANNQALPLVRGTIGRRVERAGLGFRVRVEKQHVLPSHEGEGLIVRLGEPDIRVEGS